jgi:hypothetical protein
MFPTPRGYDGRAAREDRDCGEMNVVKEQGTKTIPGICVQFLGPQRVRIALYHVLYILQVLQSQSPDIGLFDIDLSSPSPVASSPFFSPPAPLVW